MATPTYQQAKAKFFGTGYELRDYLARTISGKNPDGSTFEIAGGSGGSGGSGAIPVTTIATSGSAQTLTFPAHGEKIYILNLTTDCTITLDGSAAPSDEGAYITLLVTANGHVITWADSAISWANGEAPLLSSQEDQITLLSVASGARYRGGRGWADIEGPPTPTAPTVTSSPTISGSTTAGSTLTRTVGAASGHPTPTPTTQWRKDGVAIIGQTGATYVTDNPDDVDGVIDVLVTWTNGVSPAASADSNNITVTASGGGGGGAFARMTTPAAGLLTSVSPEVGGPITLNPASGGTTSAVVTAAHRVRSNDANDTYYTFGGTPPGADYEVTADLIRLVSMGGYAGILFRWDPTVLTGYVFRLGIGGALGQWQCYRFNAGTPTEMGTPVSATGALDVTQGIRIAGTGANIVASVGGVGDIFNVTDATPILSVGKSGIFFYQATTDTTGVHLSNFAAT